MNSLKAAYVNEMFKISKKKKLIVAGILAVFALLLAAAVVVSIDTIVGIRLASSGNFALLVLPFLMYTLIPLFSAFICIDMFSGEFTSETIKLTLTRPASRFKIFLAKTLASATFTAAFLAFTLAVSLVFSAFFDITVKSASDAITAYIAAFVPLFVLSQLVILISNLARGSASAFMLSVIIFITFKALEMFIPQLRSFFFTAGFDWYNLIIGTTAHFGKILRLFTLFVGYAVSLFAAGYYFFEKRAI